MAKPRWKKIEAGEYEYVDDNGVLGGAALEYGKHGKLGYRWNAWTFNEWLGFYGRLSDAKAAVEHALRAKA